MTDSLTSRLEQLEAAASERPWRVTSEETSEYLYDAALGPVAYTSQRSTPERQQANARFAAFAVNHIGRALRLLEREACNEPDGCDVCILLRDAERALAENATSRG